MKIQHTICLLGLSAVTAFFSLAGSAEAEQIVPVPPLTIVPTFDCSATVDATTGMVTITHTNAAAVSKTAPVVAIIKTPNGNADAFVCGSAFATSKTAKVSFPKPATKDKSWIYTCTAKVGTGTCPDLK
jgi:hypothetical protein